MKAIGERYVVDTSALGRIKKRRRTSAYFIENAVIPSQVLYEARGFPDIDELRALEYPTTATVLEHLVAVMATVPDLDTELVNLYANLGDADPFVVACALDGQTRDSYYLVAPDWVVVTADGAVQRKAAEFGLCAMNEKEFARIIDASEPR